jgi:uncharacterized membrane protein YfcA
LLTSVALAAGAVDAVAGGGGLLTLPALLATGLPPHLALGTNKGQSVFGSGAALVRYARSSMVGGSRALVAFPAGLAGSFLGASLVMRLRPESLRPLVLILLIAVAAFLAFRPQLQGRKKDVSTRRELLVAAATGLVIGAYDGFFGPGTGTFLIIAFVLLLGDELARASANAKVVNFASNLAAMALFASRDAIVWKLAVPMAAAQFAGGWLGAHLAVRRGDRLVRGAVLAVVLALSVKMGSEILGLGLGP